MQITSRSSPIFGVLLALCACAESATAPSVSDAGTRPLDITVPKLARAERSTGTAATTLQRTSDLPLPPELEGEDVPSDFLRAPGISAYDVALSVGGGLATGYAWMNYWATGAAITLTVSTQYDGRSGFSQTLPRSDTHFLPGFYSLDDVVQIPYDARCNSAATASGIFTVWHQFFGKLGGLVRWGDMTISKDVNAIADVCPPPDPSKDVPGGGTREDAVVPEEGYTVCVYLVTYVNYVEVSEQLLGCYTA